MKPMRQEGTEAGALAAVRFAVTNLERVMAHAILTTSEKRRPELMRCLMEKIYEWQRSVPGCKPKDDKGPGDGQGPDCQKGWLEVNDYCIPPPDPENS